MKSKNSTKSEETEETNVLSSSNGSGHAGFQPVDLGSNPGGSTNLEEAQAWLTRLVKSFRAGGRIVR